MKLPRRESLGTVYEKAYSSGSRGLSYWGQTLVRATGFASSRYTPQRSSVFTYSRLKLSNPCSLKGSGERSSQAAKAVLGRPSASRCAVAAAKGGAGPPECSEVRRPRGEPRRKRQRPREARALDGEAGLGGDAARE